MNFSKAVIVLAPGCPAGLIKELLGAGILPSETKFEVILPPDSSHQYDHLINRQNFSAGSRFLQSPARSFFSPHHLNWLYTNLRSFETNLLLIVKSPYQDPPTTLISLLVLMLSGKAITLLFATPEAVIDLNGQGFSERWISQPLNLKILAREFCRLFWFLNPLFLMYFVMFGGLILRKSLSNYLSSFPIKSYTK